MHRLPSRYTPEVNESILHEAAQILAAAAASGKPRPQSRAALAGALLSILAIVGLGFLGREDQRGSGVPFDRSSIIAADATGTTAKLQDFVPETRAEEQPRSSAKVASPAVVRTIKTQRSAASHVSRDSNIGAPAPCVGCTSKAIAEAEPVDVLFDESVFGEGVAALPAPSGLLVNLGTRIPVVLTHDVTTGAGPAPVTARVEGNLGAAQLGYLRGSLVVGEGLSVDESDRAQVVFSAMVVDGKTVPLQGLALGVDDELGLPGKLVRKASKRKNGVGRVLGALGGAASTLSFGLLGPRPDLADLTAAGLAQEAGRDVQGLRGQWSLSDKAIRLMAGTPGLLYLRADLLLP